MITQHWCVVQSAERLGGALTSVLLQVVDNEGGGLPGLSENDRLAAERAIACQLLPVTYDGSPLVRAELAAALARFAAGHAVLFKVSSLSCLVTRLQALGVADQPSVCLNGCMRVCVPGTMLQNIGNTVLSLEWQRSLEASSFWLCYASSSGCCCLCSCSCFASSYWFQALLGQRL